MLPRAKHLGCNWFNKLLAEPSKVEAVFLKPMFSKATRRKSAERFVVGVFAVWMVDSTADLPFPLRVYTMSSTSGSYRRPGLSLLSVGTPEGLASGAGTPGVVSKDIHKDEELWV